MKNRKSRPQRRPSEVNARLAKCHAAVIGTGPIGRQVAILLASLRVRHLSLYDQRIVTEKDMSYGFMDFDVGTPAVDAVANIAHQYHPQMELLTYDTRFRRSHLNSWKSGLRHAVFLCNESAVTRNMHWLWVHSSAQFLATCEVGTEAMDIVCSDQPARHSPTPNPTRQTGGKPDVMAVHLAAAFMVQQFQRWLRRLPCVSAMQFDVTHLKLNIQK
ncbi:MAG: ThiF family adenylyltransferase [Gemmatales bacterium]